MTEITLDQAAQTLDNSKKLSLEERTRLETQKRAGVVTPIVLAKALGIRPQMVYNYIREGRIPAEKDPETQKMVIRRETAEAWVQGRLQKAANKKAEVEAQKQG